MLYLIQNAPKPPCMRTLGPYKAVASIISTSVNVGQTHLLEFRIFFIFIIQILTRLQGFFCVNSRPTTVKHQYNNNNNGKYIFYISFFIFLLSDKGKMMKTLSVSTGGTRVLTSSRLRRLHRLETQSGRVDAVSFPRRRRPVVKNVSKVSATLWTQREQRHLVATFSRNSRRKKSENSKTEYGRTDRQI